MSAETSEERSPVVVAGFRTPFLHYGTDFRDLMSYDLARMALKGLLDRVSLPPSTVRYVVFGSVLNEPRTSNVAREAVIGAGLPHTIPAHTVTMACISGLQAITHAAEAISLGKADTVVAGGTESLSSLPILLRRPMRQKLLALRKLRGPLDYLRWLWRLRPSDFLPEVPEIAEFSNDLTMGAASDRMSAHWGIGREEQDRFALRSHLLADRAAKQGLLSEEIMPVPVPPRFQVVDRDNGIRGDTDLDRLSKLPPVFHRPFGTATAGNSSFLSDGAAAALIMSAAKAAALGLKPLARIVSYAYAACDPFEELLMGPAYAVPKVLRDSGLTLKDIDVLEFHEAFAGQILSNIRALESNRFGREKLGLDGKVGDVPMERLNALGGSLSLGHPFGATGIRLVTTCCRRLKREGGRFGLVASCAASGLGHAMLLERIP